VKKVVSGIEGREMGIVAVMPVTRWWVDIFFFETCGRDWQTSE
jgi:hypothetical protein